MHCVCMNTFFMSAITVLKQIVMSNLRYLKYNFRQSNFSIYDLGAWFASILSKLYLFSKGKIPIPRCALQTFLHEHMFYPMDVQFKDLYLVPFPHFYKRVRSLYNNDNRIYQFIEKCVSFIGSYVRIHSIWLLVI